jgi:hypothetical protein
MNKKKLLVLIIVVLSLTVFWISKQQINKHKQSDIQFNLSPKDTTDEIRIIDNKSTCILKRTTDGWKVDDLTKAKDLHVEFMLAKLRLLKMDFPTSQKEKNRLKDTLVNHGRTIELMYKGKKIYDLCFLEYRGKNIALNRKQNPYYVTIPGNSLMSLQKLIPAQAESWMKNILIDIPKENISYLTLSYPHYEEKSFCIRQIKKGTYQLLNNQNEIVKNAETIEILDYLSFYKGIVYTRYHTKDYSLSTSPIFDLKIIINDLNTIECTGYQLYQQKKEDSDQNHCGIILNKKDTVIVRYADIDPLLVEMDYFLKK